LDIPQESLEFIGRINNASIPTRYPDDIRRIVKDYPEPVARKYLEKATEIIRWLREHPNLKTSSDASAES
jgi:HEPN domain-containing protein